jgi:sirohydrochlorin ferrochelatase
MDASKKWGVLVISHGSRNPDWVWMVDESICKLQLPEGTPLDSSFLEAVAHREIQDGIDTLEAKGVTDLIVVPLFISSASTHMEEIQYALGIIEESSIETDIGRMRIQANIHFCAPIDEDPLIAEICYENIRDLSRDPAREIVLIIGHGSDEMGFGERWQEMIDGLKIQIQSLGGFAVSDTAMLHPDEIASKVAQLENKYPEYRIIVAPLFLSEGYFTKKVIPERLADAQSVAYNGRALLPHPNITKWMQKQIAQFL